MAEYIDKQLVIGLIKERYKRSDAILADINNLPVVKSSNEMQESNTGWINRKIKEPEKNGQYWCRYIFDGNEDNPFYQALYYYRVTNEKPHFQHEIHKQMPIKVTHWMPINEPKI